MLSNAILMLLLSFGVLKSYNLPCTVESASLEPKLGNKFVAGGEDMWVRIFDFHTGEEIGELLNWHIIRFWSENLCQVCLNFQNHFF